VFVPYIKLLTWKAILQEMLQKFSARGRDDPVCRKIDAHYFRAINSELAEELKLPNLAKLFSCNLQQ
jgi:hypothetical protein